MNDGGKENGCDGNWLMWFIRHNLKCSVAPWAASCCCWSGGKLGEAGELSALDPAEFDREGVSDRVDCRGGYGCTCGAELSVYIVRSGIS